MSDFILALASHEDRAKELAALARMVCFARQSADALQVPLALHCLDMTLWSLIEEMENAGVNVSAIVGKKVMSAVKELH